MPVNIMWISSGALARALLLLCRRRRASLPTIVSATNGTIAIIATRTHRFIAQLLPVSVSHHLRRTAKVQDDETPAYNFFPPHRSPLCFLGSVKNLNLVAGKPPNNAMMSIPALGRQTD